MRLFPTTIGSISPHFSKPTAAAIVGRPRIETFLSSYSSSFIKKSIITEFIADDSGCRKRYHQADSENGTYE